MKKWMAVCLCSVLFCGLLCACGAENNAAAEESRLSKVTTYDGNGDFLQSYEYVYDEDGNHTKDLYLGRSEDTGEIVYSYDSNGNLIEEVEKYSKISEEFVTTYTYDENGLCIESVDHRNEKTEYRYDQNGYIIKEILFDSEGQWFCTHNYKNDEHGEWIEMISEYASGSGSTFTQENEYDDKGNRIKAVIYSEDGTVERTHIYEYTD